MLIAVTTRLVPWLVSRMAGQEPVPTGGVLVVLAAEQTAAGEAGPATQMRCQWALRIWLGGHFDRLVISGGASNRPALPAPPLAEVMAQWFQARAVPAEALAVDFTSASTRESALHTARLLAGYPGPIALVTSDYHALRARLCFRRAGLAVAVAAAPDAVHSEWPRGMRTLAKEAIKLGYYWLRGWLTP